MADFQIAEEHALKTSDHLAVHTVINLDLIPAKYLIFKKKFKKTSSVKKLQYFLKLV